MAELLVVTSKVKDAIKAADCNCGGDLTEALSKLVEEEIKKAVKRCQENGRKTVRGCDL